MYLKNLDEDTSVYELDSMQSAHLAKVLRMKEGQEVELFNGSGLSCKAVIVEISKKFTKVQATSSFVSEDIPTKTITAIIPFIKKDNLFYMTQKLTEMGSAELAFYKPDKLDQSLFKKDLLKFEKKLKDIIIGGCKQSGVNFMPNIKCFQDLSSCLDDVQIDASKCFTCSFDLNADNKLTTSDFDDCNKYIFITGAESGFSDKERFNMKERNIAVRSLGKNILRAETAPIVGVTLFQSFLGRI